MPFDEWRAGCVPSDLVTGPGVDAFADRLAGLRLAESRTATAASLLALGLPRFEAGERDDPFRLEPLYLRVSSAEANWEKNRPRTGMISRVDGRRRGRRHMRFPRYAHACSHAPSVQAADIDRLESVTEANDRDPLQ